jgi:hypothetical protein
MQLHPDVEPAGEGRRSGCEKRIALLVVGNAIGAHPRPFIVERRGLQLALGDECHTGAVSNGHDRRYGPESSEFRQDAPQPALDPCGIEVETVAGVDARIGAHPPRDASACLIPKCAFGMGFSHIEYDCPTAHHSDSMIDSDYFVPILIVSCNQYLYALRPYLAIGENLEGHPVP